MTATQPSTGSTRALGLGLFAASFILCTLLAAPAARAEPRAYTADDLVTMARISDPRPSPDGTRIVYALRTTDLEADRGRTDLWMVPTGGGEPARLTTDPGSEASPRWSPDGRWLYFLSGRSGSSQVWRLPMAGGEARQVSDLAVDVGLFVLSPAGDRLAVALEVFPDCDDSEGGALACTAERLTKKSEEKTSGQLYDRIFVRHWDVWKDGRQSHLFTLELGEDGTAGSPAWVSHGLDADIPSKPFGGDEEIVFTPDGKGLVFGARISGSDEPWSTNFDLYHAPADGSAPPRKLTENPAWDTQPAFSPDGETLAYLAMRRPGFEADRLRLVERAWNDGQPGPETVIAEAWDRSIGSFAFTPDGMSYLVTAGDTGNVPLVRIDRANGEVEKLVAEGHVRSPSMAGERIVFARDDLGGPVDLYSIDVSGGDLQQLTEVNRSALEGVAMGGWEQFSFTGAAGDTVYGYLVKPANFDPGERYPLAFLIHGGPQGSFDNDFHYRWNPQVYTGAGYAAVMIDFHGSTGYGQDFTDSITGDWGGKPLEDLQKGLAHVLERNPWIDGDRACALGASYGGYMINWIAGNWSDRFRCLVNHDGLFDLRSMYYSTEELWFPEWEMGGTPWENPRGFEKHNPANYVQNWQTPMLVIHGALDYRVVDSQGLAAFTALQRRGIPSQLLFYPDENHWVLSPANSVQWHETVLAWLGRWTSEDDD